MQVDEDGSGSIEFPEFLVSQITVFQIKDLYIKYVLGNGEKENLYIKYILGNDEKENLYIKYVLGNDEKENGRQ